MLGRQDGFVVWLAEGEQDSHPVGTAVGDSDGEQLGHCDVGIMLGALVGNALGVDVSVALGALAVRCWVGRMTLVSETRTASSWDTAM